MFAFLSSLMDRVKALLVTDAASELESEFTIRTAERKANLLRLASRYEAEGLPTVAAQLRQQTEVVDFTRPLAGVLPGIRHLTDEPIAAIEYKPASNSISSVTKPSLPDRSTVPANTTRNHKR